MFIVLVVSVPSRRALFLYQHSVDILVNLCIWTQLFYILIDNAQNFFLFFFFFNDTATTEIYPLSLHDAFPISRLGSSNTDFRYIGAPRPAGILFPSHISRQPAWFRASKFWRRRYGDLGRPSSMGGPEGRSNI